MPTLDDSNPRDDLLIEILEEQSKHPFTIAEINNRLVRNGFPELDIIDHRRSLRPASQKKMHLTSCAKKRQGHLPTN